MFRRVFTRVAARFLAQAFVMRISFNFSYSESLFVVVYPSFYFILGQDPARATNFRFLVVRAVQARCVVRLGGQPAMVSLVALVAMALPVLLAMLTVRVVVWLAMGRVLLVT